MAISWTYNPADFEERDFSPIPAGDHRVRISDVIEKTFNSGNSGFEITLEVSGHSSKLWFYLVLNQADPKKTNQNIGTFFESFGISDSVLDHYRAWAGKVGGVRVKHEDYNGSTQAKVAFCLSRKNQEKLPPAKFSGTAPAPAVNAGGYSALGNINADDLPFA